MNCCVVAVESFGMVRMLKPGVRRTSSELKGGIVIVTCNRDSDSRYYQCHIHTDFLYAKLLDLYNCLR